MHLSSTCTTAGPSLGAGTKPAESSAQKAGLDERACEPAVHSGPEGQLSQGMQT